MQSVGLGLLAVHALDSTYVRKGRLGIRKEVRRLDIRVRITCRMTLLDAKSIGQD